MIFDVVSTEFKEIVAVEDEYTRFRDMMAGAGYQIEEDIPLTLSDVPAREFIIETGAINFVRRILTVRNFAISIHAMVATSSCLPNLSAFARVISTAALSVS